MKALQVQKNLMIIQNLISDVPISEASEEAQDDSQQVIQSRNSFKYKSSHPEDKIIDNRESPKRTRSHFRPEESALGCCL